MDVVTLVLLSTAVIVLGAAAGKPYGWVAGGLGVLAILAGLTPLLR